MEEGFQSTIKQEDSFQTKRGSISNDSPTNITLWSRMSASQEDPDPKVDGSEDENDLVDVWLYQTGQDQKCGDQRVSMSCTSRRKVEGDQIEIILAY